MSLDTDFKRQHDRQRAHRWLSICGHRERALRLIFHLQQGAPLILNQTGHTKHLKSLSGPGHLKFLNQGLASLLVGEGWIKPIPVPGQKPGRYDKNGVMLHGSVKSTHISRKFLAAAAPVQAAGTDPAEAGP